jgi:hypothetical protein
LTGLAPLLEYESPMRFLPASISDTILGKGYNSHSLEGACSLMKRQGTLG